MTINQMLIKNIKALTNGDATMPVYVYCNPQNFYRVHGALLEIGRKHVTLIDDPSVPVDDVYVSAERLDREI